MGKKLLIDININIDFLQDNVSLPKKNVLRGTSFSKIIFPRKINWTGIRKVIDEIVDAKDSKCHFSKHKGKIILKENDNKNDINSKGCALMVLFH